MKLFLSYPSIVNPIVENIYKHLPQGAFAPWIDTERISVAASIPEELEQNIEDAEFFISFLNAEALKSDSVRLELKHAVAREKALGRPFIIPILLNGFPKESLPDHLRDNRRFLTYNGTNYPRQIASFAIELTDELLRLACERPPMRCEGMAAVYYFSFVDQLVKNVFTPKNADNLLLKWASGERRLKGAKRMELHILLPGFLDEDHLNDLLAKPNLLEGELMAGEKTLFRKILFDRVIEQGPDANVIFYDVPNILNSAAKLFAQERSNRAWKKLNRMELLAFKYNIEKLADKNITKTPVRAAVMVDPLPDASL